MKTDFSQNEKIPILESENFRPKGEFPCAKFFPECPTPPQSCFLNSTDSVVDNSTYLKHYFLVARRFFWVHFDALQKSLPNLIFAKM